LKYIDTPSLLEEACLVILRSSWAGLDTEADSLHHYIEKLCLVQVSTDDEDFVIDPLAGLDLTGLVSILNDKLLILQGADFDIRILKKFYPSFLPKEIFDTMIAAQLLGYDKQGLADLAFKHCGVVLPKSSQKADWSRRPLDDHLVTYAANDTHYLRPIYLQMKKELEALGRLSWQEQTCARLLKTTLTPRENPHAGCPWQIKGCKDLSPRGLAILKELWQWREDQAQKKDRPSFKILHSEILVDIARWSVTAGGRDVALLPEAPRNLKGEYRQVLNEVLEKGWRAPELGYVSTKSKFPHKRMNAQSQKRFEILKQERDKIGQALKIQPSLLATNAVLETLAIEAPKTLKALEVLDCLLPWQTEIFERIIFSAISDRQ
jgi:ribonuclease D